jgi:large subunit ribosomal protein L4e
MNKMKVKIFDTKGAEKGSKELPSQFNESYRPDLIKRAVVVIQANKRQQYGADPRAGKKHSAYVSKRRSAFRSTYGIGQSRTPRKAMSLRGTRFNWVGAFVPQTVGGRRAHHPKAEKIWSQKINKKEKRKAIRSALAATFNLDLIKEKNAFVPKAYPFILANDFEKIDRTKELKKILISLGFKDELDKSLIKKIRSGVGKLRGRKYKKRKSLLFVVPNDCGLTQAAKNLQGVDLVKVNELNTELLAPGTHAGRMTLFTESAIDVLDKDKLFTIEPVKKISKKKEKKFKAFKKKKIPAKKKVVSNKAEVKK